MKKYIVVFLAIGVILAFASMAMAYTPGAGIVGTPHDLSTTSGLGVAIGNADGRICVFCHTPHFAAKAADMAVGQTAPINYYPLWNHDLATVTSYQTYTNGLVVDPMDPTNPMNLQATLDAQYATGPGGVSKLCLSCHDGSVALNSYGNFQGNPSASGGGTNLLAFDAGYVIGQNTGGDSDLSNHHPVGFNYDAAAALDFGLWDSGSPILNNSSGLSIAAVLWGGNIECVSCHSVHNKDNDGTRFLWTDDNNGSALCLSCHNK